MKLSKAQRRVLTVMAEPGCRAKLYTRGNSVRACFAHPIWMKSKIADPRPVRSATLKKLAMMELIKGTEREWWLTIYTITDAGREWVRQSRLA